MPGLFEGFVVAKRRQGVTLAVLIVVSLLCLLAVQQRDRPQAQGGRAVGRRLLPEGIHGLLPRGSATPRAPSGSCAWRARSWPGARGGWQEPTGRAARSSSCARENAALREQLGLRREPAAAKRIARRGDRQATPTTCSPRSPSTRARARACARACPWWPGRERWRAGGQGRARRARHLAGPAPVRPPVPRLGAP